MDFLVPTFDLAQFGHYGHLGKWPIDRLPCFLYFLSLSSYFLANGKINIFLKKAKYLRKSFEPYKTNLEYLQ